MRNEKKIISDKLEDELKSYTFSKQADVLKQVKTKSISEKLSAWWNKDITISLVPIGVATIILISATVAPAFLNDEIGQYNDRKIVEIGGNYYWSDLYEAVKRR